MNLRAARLCVIAACSMAFFMACSSSSETSVPMATPTASVASTVPSNLGDVVRDETNLGDPITLAAGQRAQITLSSNRTTGYQWGLSLALDENVVKVVGSEYIAPSTPIPGRGGSEQWTFLATGAGQATVSMKYFRSFEPTATPAKQVSFTIVVK